MRREDEAKDQVLSTAGRRVVTSDLRKVLREHKRIALFTLSSVR